jgi:hypothetical protein
LGGKDIKWRANRLGNETFRSSDAERECPMSMDGDYQTKDATYDAINKKLILGIVVLGIVVIGAWYLFAGLGS